MPGVRVAANQKAYFTQSREGAKKDGQKPFANSVALRENNSNQHWRFTKVLSFKENLMVSQDLLEILRCPACVRETEGLLDFHKETWLICQDCGRKYPVKQDIPVMLIDEGDKWVETAVEDLPIPPPEK
jgi:uncharacterized protein YbaR (Trm112 family)